MNFSYKLLLFFLLLHIGFYSYGQKTFTLKDSSRLELSENGKATYYYADGRKMSEGKLVNGKRQGEWKFYKGKEGLDAVEKYENGKMEGMATYYYIGTELKQNEGTYSNGKRNGEWKSYSLYKELIYSVVNFRDGILSGPATYYDTNTGIKYGEGVHGNGKRQGEWKFYAHRNGKLDGIENYKDGLMEGVASYYDTVTNCGDPACSKLADGQYERNLRTGVWTFYDSKSGRIVSKENYKDSLLNGLSVFYDVNTGNVVAKDNYKDGMLHGACSYYDSVSGYKRMEAIFDKGEHSGVTTEFFNDARGVVKSISRYKKDTLHDRYQVTGTVTITEKDYRNDMTLHGTCSYYDSISGFKNMEVTFENGEDTGATTEFFIDARQIVKSILRYRGDTLHGAYEEYDSVSGKKSSIIYYTNGDITGISGFDEEGMLSSYNNMFYNGDSSYRVTYNPLCSKIKTEAFYKDTSESEGILISYYHCSDRKRAKAEIHNSLADGEALYYDSSTGKLLAEGKFKKGERDGNWIIYNVRSGKPVLEESYKNGEQYGKQIWYDTSGNINAYYNYKNGVKSGDALINHYGSTQPWIRFKFNNDSLHGSLTSFYPDGKLKRQEEYVHGNLKSTKCYSHNGDTTEYYPIIVREEFEEDVMNYIGRNLQYPKEAKDSKAEGKVTVRFKIHESGMVSDAEVIKSAGHGMDEEALRIISQMPPWQPAYFDGVPYATYKTLPIVFWLQNTE